MTTKYLKLAKTIVYQVEGFFVAMATITIIGSSQSIGFWMMTIKGTILRNNMKIGSVFSEKKVCKDL